MGKSEMTKQIEEALKCYSPKELGEISFNPFRGWVQAYEVPVTCGTTEDGLVDCVRVAEYFGDLQYTYICRAFGKKAGSFYDEFISRVCEMGHLSSKEAPLECNAHGCRLNSVCKNGTPKIVVVCFEIKVSRADFKSKNGHNFVGNLNYYVVPAELQPKIMDLVEDGVGVLAYLHEGEYRGLRRKKDATYREMTDEQQKWMILNVLKRRNFGPLEV